MFPASFIQELKDKNPIEEVVGQYVDLKRKGANMWACCPFHNEKTPSFSVNVNGQFYHCFGCGVGGDVITFIAEQEHLTKFEAIEYLANRAGMQMPSKVDSDAEARAQQDKKRHYEMHKLAAKFYVENLVRDRGMAKAYLKKRGITLEAVKKFGIGFAPDAKEALRRLLTQKGFTDRQMLDSGLLVQGNYGMMDKFRGRLMFPIIDLYGNVIAFGGRVLDDSLPKYMNSPESRFYNKRRHLFGLNLVKNQKPITHIVLVEGYMDVVMLTSFGLTGVVASLGTALTEQQANLIKRFSSEVFLCYDGDAAGQKAALRGAAILQKANLNPRVIDLPGGQDPDDYVKAKGLDGFEELMDRALLPHRYEVERLSEQYDLGQENQRRDFALAALRIVARLKNSLDKEDMIKYLEVRTGYSTEVLTQDGRSLQKKVEEKPAKKPDKPKKRVVSAGLKAERLILKLALNGRRERLLEELEEQDFSDPFHREVYQMIREGPLEEEELQARIEGAESSAKLVEIRMQNIGREKDKAFSDCKHTIVKEKLNGELQGFLQRLEKAGLSEEQRTELLEEIGSIQMRLKKLKDL